MLKIKRLLVFVTLFNVFSIAAQTINADTKYSGTHFKMPDNIQPGDYMDRTVIIKVNAKYRSNCSAASIENGSFKELYTAIGGSGLKKKFPNTKAPVRYTNAQGQRFADLSLIYEFSYSASISLEKVINKFISLQLFEYVEPHYIPHSCYTPNDPDMLFQYAMTNIQAENAWGVNTTTARGDTNVVIGIADTGVEPAHSDLVKNIKYNYADTIGAGDEDSDGYIDNYRGWDLADNDNDPFWGGNPHGVHVSGIAAASVDNATGMAGVGFNCKFLPVKVADASGTLIKAYEGITYAAEHGCAVINCSWGGAGGGQLGQDVVTYATINKNSLVVAAAGNDGADQLFFPASYDYVISVGSTKDDDRRASTSNYNYTVDVCAPGESIYSTYSGNSFSFQSGTSMASPCAAGAAAIIKSFYPSYTALQIGARLKTTCDNIYPLMSPTYKDKLGSGRINLYRAITDAVMPSVTMSLRNITDNDDNAFVVGDTLDISGNYTNYLGPAVNLTATLSTTSVFINMLDNTTTLGAIATMGVANNNADPFKVRIVAGTPQNQSVTFKITYSDPATSYTAVEYFTVVVNVDYINIAINDIATSVNGRGRIGYNADNQVGGLGFNYMNQGTILYDAGFMIGIDTLQVSDAVRGTAAGSNDADFQSVVNVRRMVPSVFSEFDVDGKFNDNPSASGSLPVSVHHQAFAWTTAGDRKYVILQYIISNTGTVPLTNLYAGICADWDINISTYASNRASFDSLNKMGYVYYTGINGTYAGIKLLTNSAPVVHYAIDNVAGGSGGVDLYGGGFDSKEKYTALSKNRVNAGVSGAGADVIDVVSTGPYTVAAGDSIKVAFALIAGDSLADLKKSAINAQIKYDGLTVVGIPKVENANRNVMNIYPNPASRESIIDISIAETATVELKIFNILGKEITTIVSEKMQAGAHHFLYDTSLLSNGVYYYQLSVGDKIYVEKMIVNK
ncbi:MAG: S8 family serine peptidase [Bacteroidota bacterium]